MDHVSLHAQSHTAFSSTVSLYQEKKYNGGLDLMAEGSKLSTSDFLCEVEVAARKCLDTLELLYFNEAIKSLKLIVSESDNSEFDNELHQFLTTFSEHTRESMAKVDASVRAKLGKHFIQAGIFPLTGYLAAN